MQIPSSPQLQVLCRTLLRCQYQNLMPLLKRNLYRRQQIRKASVELSQNEIAEESRQQCMVRKRRQCSQTDNNRKGRRKPKTTNDREEKPINPYHCFIDLITFKRPLRNHRQPSPKNHQSLPHKLPIKPLTILHRNHPSRKNQ